MKKAKSFNVADRVMVEHYSGAGYMPNQDKLTCISVLKYKGVIVDEKDGGYLVKLDRVDPRWPHTTHLVATQRMLTRLVRKKRREAWIADFGNRDIVFTSIQKAKQSGWNEEDLTHVREVKRK